jgi:hypothetical protein
MVTSKRRRRALTPEQAAFRRELDDVIASLPYRIRQADAAGKSRLAAY